MYVCICNNIRNKEIDSMAQDGCSSASDVFRRMGCRPVCGKCVPEISDALRDRRSGCVSK
ncbi:MAG: (2Fe-2S)-binding protein [Rickettsiales bacterium]|jgi:bacterioferritin-associated ferredoxin|nr:(2Fe-2S)-binding protein [Rickettsiales bacterium]